MKAFFHRLFMWRTLNHSDFRAAIEGLKQSNDAVEEHIANVRATLSGEVASE